MAKLRAVNPATGKILGEVKISTKDEIEKAVVKAKNAFPDWRQLSLAKRGKLILRWASLIEKNQEKLAKLITQEMGKPLREAEDELKEGVELLQYVVEEGNRVLVDEVLLPKLSQKKIKEMERKGIEDKLKYLATSDAEVISVMRYDPVGVVGVIKPWNYPLSVPIMGIAPALLTGNCVLFKPAEEVPLFSQELTNLAWQAGVPKEVMQLLQGRALTGAMLVDSQIDMISFTGSTAVGKEIAKKCSQRLLKYVLELGGSSPALVLNDADLDQAVSQVVSGRFTNCGQICSAIKRVLVEQSVANRFISKLAKQIRDLRVGDPLDKKSDLGPLVSEKQLKKLQAQVTKAIIQGGRIIVGGRRLYDEPFNKGWFHEPTLMIHVQPKMAIMQEEVFGPVLPVCEVENLDQAIEYANLNPYGLTASVFTSSRLKAERVMHEVVAGTIYVNETGGKWGMAPWSGLKDSGFGVGGSQHGIWEFCHKRHILVKA
jgi:acyl-CoA reductase-like NAD-dependent aldehyde dehydrogenase